MGVGHLSLSRMIVGDRDRLRRGCEELERFACWRTEIGTRIPGVRTEDYGRELSGTFVSAPYTTQMEKIEPQPTCLCFRA
jgi:hypothetical protein